MSSAQVGGHDAGSGIPPESGVDVKERDPHRMNQHLRVSSILQVTNSILHVPCIHKSYKFHFTCSLHT